MPAHKFRGSILQRHGRRRPCRLGWQEGSEEAAMQRLLMIITLIATAGSCALAQLEAPNTPGRTMIYLVRHGEDDSSTPNQALTQQGEARARIFAATVRDIPFSHVFSTHTTRSRQAVEAVAKARGLSVIQLPNPGSVVDGTAVDEKTPAKTAVKPLVDALRQLPSGSVALVGANSGNVYAILNGLGVRVGTSDQPCTLGSTCVPCLDNTCFPREEFDNFWILIVDAVGQRPQLIHLRYGTPTARP